MSHYRELLDEATRVRRPLEVCLELTHHCTHRCAHCYVPDFGALDLLSTGRILDLLEELAEAGTLFLGLSGGEPLTRPDWAVIARRARELGFFVVVLTNGFLVDEAAADTLAGLAASVEVSVLSLDEAVMDGITGRRGSALRARRAVSLLRDRGADVVVKTPLLTPNRESIPAVAAWAESTGATFRASPVVVARRDGDLAPLALRVGGEALREFLAGPHHDCGAPAAVERASASDTPCAAGIRFCAITATGDVVACNVLPGSAGNVREGSFREVWDRSPWFARLRSLRRGDLSACRECAHLSACSRCPGQALVEAGDVLAPVPSACERAALESGIRAARAATASSPDPAAAQAG